MKHLYLFILALGMAITGFAQSQSAEKAIGLRAGLTPGIEYRVFSGPFDSYKALISTRKRGIQLTGLKEFHVPQHFDFGDQVTFVYGFGAHIGFESWYAYYDDKLNPDYWHSERKTGPVVGLDGLAAFEYSVPEIPLVAGIELKPYFNLFGKNFFQVQPFDFAFTVKYTF